MTDIKVQNQQKIKITPELKEAITQHNSFVQKVCKRHKKDRKKYEQKINEIEDRKIVPREELKGSGLRRTFVALGYDWVQTNFIDVWKSNLRREKVERKKSETKIFLKVIYKPLICIICISLCTILVARICKCKKRFIPKIDLPKLEHGREYAEMAFFAKTVLDDFASHGELGLEDRWNENADPEIKYWSACLLQRFKNISAVSVKNIYVDQHKPECFHVYCEGMLNDPKIIIQCANIENNLKLLLIE